MEPRSTDAVTWVEHLLSLIQTTDAQGVMVPFEVAVDRAVAMLLEARASRRKVMLIGNGGSAAIASHIQTDLCGSLSIRGLVFNEPSLLTALANDHGYEQAFRRLMDLWADPGDVLVAISSSGCSANIINACDAARAKGMGIITFSGFRPDNPLRSRGAINVYVASSFYGPVETSHGALAHHLTDKLLAVLATEVRG